MERVNSKKILVISDVHADFLTLEKILKHENDVDLKIFLGDLQSKKYEVVKKNFDFYVLGNSDYFRKDVKNEIVLNYEGIIFFITHGHLYGSFMKKIDFNRLLTSAKKYQANVILYGHDHIKNKSYRDKVLFFNPGSTSFPRDSEVGSYGIIEIENKKIKKITHNFITF